MSVVLFELTFKISPYKQGANKSKSLKNLTFFDVVCQKQLLFIAGSDHLAQNIRTSVSRCIIRKTIDEIASNQASLVPHTMPQNALLETAVSVSNIPGNAASSANELVSDQSNLDLMRSGNAIFQGQNWNTRNIDSGTGEICETAGFSTGRNCISDGNNSASISSYPTTNISSCFDPNQMQRNDFQAQQQQQFMPRSNIPHTTHQLDHFLQTAVPLQSYEQHISQDTYTSATPGLDSMSAYDKVCSIGNCVALASMGYCNYLTMCLINFLLNTD